MTLALALCAPERAWANGEIAQALAAVDAAAAPENLAESLVGPLRALWDGLDAPNPSVRSAAWEDLKAEVVSHLASVAGADPAARSRARLAVARAEEMLRARRTIALHRKLKCDCPTENFSRTLEGCWEPCVEAQRRLVQKWLAEGATDDEVIDRMVEHSGTTKVLVTPRGYGTVATVLAIITGASLFVGFVLWRLVRGSKRGSAAVAGEPPVAAPAAEADGELDARLEAELRELEDR